MEQALARHPWVARVEVRRAWPPALTVRVVERRAAALVELSGLYLVDEGGEPFKRAAAGDGLDLPLVTGLARADYVQRRAAVEPRLRGALALARAWQARGREALGRLSEIHLDPGDGTTIYVGEEGVQVRLGTGDLEAKLARLEQVLSTLGAEGRKAEVIHLDNRLHPSWVTVRLAAVASQAVKVASPRGL
jgi:cell division protein FtsQ